MTQNKCHDEFPRYTLGYSIVPTFTLHVAPGSAGCNWDCTLASLSGSGAVGWVGDPADYRRPITLTQHLNVKEERGEMVRNQEPRER